MIPKPSKVRREAWDAFNPDVQCAAVNPYLNKPNDPWSAEHFAKGWEEARKSMLEALTKPSKSGTAGEDV